MEMKRGYEGIKHNNNHHRNLCLHKIHFSKSQFRVLIIGEFHDFKENTLSI